MRAVTALPTLALLALLSGSVLAQTNGQNAAPGTPDAREPLSNSEQPKNDRHNQRIEHITVEDGGSRVSELRVGGQTQSITVQPKTSANPMPEYEVQPADGVHARPGSRSGAETVTAPRVWTLRKF